jgi:hypothetical protein
VSVNDGELPVDGGALVVTSRIPGCNFRDEGVEVADASTQSLAGEHRELQLSQFT